MSCHPCPSTVPPQAAAWWEAGSWPAECSTTDRSSATVPAGSLRVIGGKATAARTEGTKGAILRAAVEHGSLRGLEDLSMGGLASTVRMSKSGLFAHFGSKEELQLATVARAWEIFETDVLSRDPDDVSDGLGPLIERWLSFFERRVLPGGCFFVASAVEFASLECAVSEALAEAVEQQIAALESAVRFANESGELAVPKDPRQTAFALHCILVNANSLFVVNRDRGVFDLARTAIADLLGELRDSRRTAFARPA